MIVLVKSCRFLWGRVWKDNRVTFWQCIRVILQGLPSIHSFSGSVNQWSRGLHCVGPWFCVATVSGRFLFICSKFFYFVFFNFVFFISTHLWYILITFIVGNLYMYIVYISWLSFSHSFPFLQLFHFRSFVPFFFFSLPSLALLPSFLFPSHLNTFFLLSNYLVSVVFPVSVFLIYWVSHKRNNAILKLRYLRLWSPGTSIFL